MKKYLLPIVLLTIIFASCVKDRLPPAPTKIVTPTGDTLMYYWTFNNQDSATHTPDFSVDGNNAYFSYVASYIDYTNGSSVNLIGPISDTGSCLRVRNPSTSLTFVMPTTGYDSIIFAFAVEASSTTSGSTISAVSYTTDGTNYITTALTNNGGNNQYNVTTSFALQTFDFSSDPNVNNNPKFAVKITFENNNTGTSGNDRFDNVTLMGVRK